MTATYAAYATQVSDALETLLKTTRVKVEPAVEFVSCGATLHEHFVPKTSLEKHLRKCHGERRPRPISNAAVRRNAGIPQETEDSAGQVEAGTEDGENDGLQSLVGTEAEGQDATAEQEGVIAAIQRVATTAGALYEQVQAWQRIPRAFATMKDNERELVTSSSLRRWLKAELGRPGVLPTGDPLDEELVEYVAGLLDHPDFCQPDLLVLELHEFLGDSVSNIVLALWKFMIVEIGLHSLFKMEKSESGNKIQVTAAGTSQQPATINAVPMSSQTQSTDTVGERDYKRRRTSYRGKVGTKTGPAAFREMIQKHMVGLSFETDRELALGGGFCDSEDRGKYPSNPQPARREAVNWRNFTDALECKPPGGSSTVGSLIFGGDGDNQSSYLDERKSRRFNPHQAEAPEHGNSYNAKAPDAGAAEVSYYAKSNAAQDLRDRLAIAPGAVSRETLQQPTALAVVRRGTPSGKSSDYFANGMGGQGGENNQARRTRRMFAAPGGNSSFKLG
ncbi:hypothetical protein PHYPSEUDO_008936 [Phytophthora pseudosyringae]|uniref:PWI domain-containing protein n=1 Tax=Phytophthora pseudosyringae TaxID=221518 RepID=A0A8T1VG00_9STRA|nr:hypothetical protein PHYPSEUDO_008936 [Phytophthora pseudosyringae]